jgi:hypothetical protein
MTGDMVKKTLAPNSLDSQAIRGEKLLDTLTSVSKIISPLGRSGF